MKFEREPLPRLEGSLLIYRLAQLSTDAAHHHRDVRRARRDLDGFECAQIAAKKIPSIRPVRATRRGLVGQVLLT